MNGRRFDIAEFGFTEEQWKALPEDRRKHFADRARYRRLREQKLTYQREYWRKQKLRKALDIDHA